MTQHPTNDSGSDRRGPEGGRGGDTASNVAALCRGEWCSVRDRCARFSPKLVPSRTWLVISASLQGPTCRSRLEVISGGGKGSD